jgi:hypothetical protein
MGPDFVLMDEEARMIDGKVMLARTMENHLELSHTFVRSQVANLSIIHKPMRTVYLYLSFILRLGVLSYDSST